ncbi:NUDIX domain-containing protein [Ilumatobacter sp.]|uniref:NUDIX domain-containing protein n=1 Tax=Ilumatobacter sp. TaxID=1967498 RepID=UPI003B528CA1
MRASAHPTTATPHFRANVVAVVAGEKGRVLAFERIDLPGEWQLPQGGIDQDETPQVAVWRELEEETGLRASQVELVGEYPEWTAYTWPDGPRRNGRLGQAQRWFFFEVRDRDVEPTPDGVEFGAWKWVERTWLVDHVVEFRRASYRRVLLDERTT